MIYRQFARLSVLILIMAFMTTIRAAPASNGTVVTVTVPKRPHSPLEGSRIVGGVEVNIVDFSYQVSLRLKGKHACGGSIIHKNWVLTAAHCCFSPVTAMTVKAGSTFRANGGNIHHVTQKVVHNLYNPTSYDYDIALLKVKNHFTYTAKVKSIPLVTSGTELAEGTVATVSGWGTLEAGDNTLPIRLQAVSLPLLTSAACEVSYPSAITGRMFCAGYTSGGKDSCQGDSGGPLVADIAGIKQQIGVVSWGKGCAEPNYPGVYTKVSDLRDWIKTNTGNAV